MPIPQEEDFSIREFFLPFTTLKAIFWIVIIGLVVYSNSLLNGFIGDDYAQIVNNPAVHSLTHIGSIFSNSTFSAGTSGLTGIYYKPLLSTVFALLYAVFGNWAPPYHLFQVGLHIGNSILLFLIFQRFFKREMIFVLAILFLVHPINAESVLWISAVQEPLFLFFGLCSLYLIGRSPKGFLMHSGNTLLLLFSLLSKETGALFLLVVPFFWKLRTDTWKPVVWDSAVALCVYVLLRFGVAHVSVNEAQVFSSQLMQLDLPHRLLNVPAIVAFYIQTFFYPRDLMVYQRWFVTTANLSNLYVPALLDAICIIILGASGYWIYQKHPKSARLFFFFFIWFLLGIALHLQMVPLDYTVADRWFYFPIIGLLGMMGTICSVIQVKKKLYRWTLLLLLVVICGVFSLRSMVRNTNWSDASTLYGHDIQKEPNNYALQSSLGIELYNQGKLDQAKDHLRRSIDIHPNNQNWTALGLVYIKLHEIPKGEESLIKALQYKKDPFTYQTLIKTMIIADPPERTTPFIKEYLGYYPRDPFLWLYLSVAEYKSGKKEEALTDVQQSYALYPSQEATYVMERIQNDEPIQLINE